MPQPLRAQFPALGIGKADAPKAMSIKCLMWDRLLEICSDTHLDSPALAVTLRL
jgi:hypothetical protein